MMGLIVNFGIAPRLLTHNIGAVVKGDTIPLVWVCWVLEWEGAGPPRVWWVTPSHAGVVSPATGLVVHKVECFISFPNFGLHKIFYLFHGHIGRGQFIINVFLVSILHTNTHRGILKWGEFGLAVFLHFPSLQKLLCWNNHNVQKKQRRYKQWKQYLKFFIIWFQFQEFFFLVIYQLLCLYSEVLQSYDNNTWLLDTKHIMVNKKYFTYNHNTSSNSLPSKESQAL